MYNVIELYRQYMGRESISGETMKRDYGSVGTIALRASALLQAMSRDIEEQRKEFNLTEYHQTYTRNAVANCLS